MKIRTVGNNTLFYINSILYLCLLFSITAMFIPLPFKSSSYWFHAAWNLGHPILFFLSSFILLSKLTRIYKNHTMIAIGLLAGTCIAGAAIEGIQPVFGRQSSWNDAILNLCGTTAAIALNRKILKNIGALTQLNAGILLLFSCGFVAYPFFSLTSDFFISRKQFPVLLSCKTPFEEVRIKGNAETKKMVTPSETKAKSLQIRFSTDRFSNIYMDSFPENWSGYRNIKMSLFSLSPLRVHISIADDQHLNDEKNFNDRFNTTISLKKGHNLISINLDEIINSPEGRQLNIRKISKISLYTISLSEDRHVYLQGLKLSQ